jgi:hypothetical protein
MLSGTRGSKGTLRRGHYLNLALSISLDWAGFKTCCFACEGRTREKKASRLHVIDLTANTYMCVHVYVLERAAIARRTARTTFFDPTHPLASRARGAHTPPHND